MVVILGIGPDVGMQARRPRRLSPKVTEATRLSAPPRPAVVVAPPLPITVGQATLATRGGRFRRAAPSLSRPSVCAVMGLDAAMDEGGVPPPAAPGVVGFAAPHPGRVPQEPR
jgi:hypothetical protein